MLSCQALFQGAVQELYLQDDCLEDPFPANTVSVLYPCSGIKKIITVNNVRIPCDL